MAKVITDVILKDGVDETEFINDVTSNAEVDLKDRVESLSNMVVLNVEKSYIPTLNNHASVKEAQYEEPAHATVTYPSKPSKYTLSDKTIGGVWEGSGWNFNTTYPGTKWISYQHYLDTDLMVAPERTINNFTGSNVGNHHYDSDPDGKRDQMRFLGTAPSGNTGTYGEDQTYSSYYTGKHVDIVTLEGGDGITDSGYVNYHNSHPDWQDPDNAGITRMIPMNWPNLSAGSNNQVSSNNMLNDHAVGSLSASGGIYGGFAKKSSLRASYLVGSDGITSCLNAIKSWHNAKSVNGTTGLKDPTVLILEWHHPPLSKENCIKIEDIDSVTDPTLGTASKPGGGWGNDLTPFVDRGMIPFQLRDPDGTWYWVQPFSRQTQGSYISAIEQCWDDGIVIINAAGNAGATFVSNSDARWSGTYCTISGTKDLYTVDYNGSGSQNDPCSITKGSTSTSTWYGLRVYGPAGFDKSITVAAGQNSEGCPSLDMYTGRGPGIDLIGRGTTTWTAGDVDNYSYTDGYKWGTFSGTSCAMPTVAGKAACYMEKHYTLHGEWPTPQQVKDAMIAESRPTSMSVRTVDWSNVPAASSTDIKPNQSHSATACLKIDSSSNGTAPNAGWCFGDHVGTPNQQAHWNAKDFNREHTYKKRPTSGVLYPRPRKFDLPRKGEAAE